MITKIDIPYGTDSKQKLDIYMPDTIHDDTIMICHFHGGGLVEGDKAYHEYVGNFVDYGYIFADINYRLLPNVTVDEIMDDAACGVKKALEVTRIPVKNACIAGDSAGGYIAMMITFKEEYLQKYQLSPFDFHAFMYNDPKYILDSKDIPKYITDALEMPDCPLYYYDSTKLYPPMHFSTYGKSLLGFPEFTHIAVATLLRGGMQDRLTFCYYPGQKHCADYANYTEDGIILHSYNTHVFLQKLKANG